jgi:hypothetical protein
LHAYINLNTSVGAYFKAAAAKVLLPDTIFINPGI